MRDRVLALCFVISQVQKGKGGWDKEHESLSPGSVSPACCLLGEEHGGSRSMCMFTCLCKHCACKCDVSVFVYMTLVKDCVYKLSESVFTCVRE